MKRFTFIFFLTAISVGLFSQTGTKPVVEENYRRFDYQKYIQIFSDLDTSMITTGFLSDQSIQLVPFDDYDGSDSAKTISYFKWQQLCNQVKVSQVNGGNEFLYLDSIVRHAIFNEEFIPIAVIDINYNSIRTDAFEQNLLGIDNQKIIEISTGNVSPYTIKRLFAASALKSNIYQGHSVKFLFDKAFYYSNNNERETRFEIDFGDGFGLRNIALGQTIDVSYSSTGKKNIKLVKNTQLIASFSIDVKSLTVPNFSFEIPLSVQIPPNYPHGGVNVKGTGYAYTSDGSHNIRNPIIICEGFDPMNKRGWNELYTLLNCQNFIECLRANGYDFIVLNFSDGATYVERNAYLLKALIENVNARKITQNKLIVVGASMGGLVARYALSYMEKSGIDHDSRLFVSFDSPQKGATIPLGAQYWLKFFADMNDTVKYKYDNLLCSTAARQMLVYHSEYSPDPTDNPYRIDFLHNLNAIGYPQKLRKIAIANGAGNAFGQLKDNGSVFNPTDQIIYWRYRNFWTVDIDGNSWAVPNISPKTAIFYGDIELSWIAHIYQWVFTDGSLTVTMENSYPYDNAPGGTTDVTKEIADGDTDGYGDITTEVSNHCFIPTISSLAINTSNLFYNIDSDPAILSKTPFDAIYYPINKNEEHVYISEDCLEWVRDELVPHNVVLDGTHDNWNTGEVRAGNSISLKPGFNTVPGKTFHAYISPLQPCHKESMTKSEDVSNEKQPVINQIDIMAELETGNNEEAASILPNPSHGKFCVYSNDDIHIECVEVISIQGLSIYRNNNVGSNELFVDITNHPNGIYFIKLIIDGKTQTKKIIKY